MEPSKTIKTSNDQVSEIADTSANNVRKKKLYAPASLRIFGSIVDFTKGSRTRHTDTTNSRKDSDT